MFTPNYHHMPHAVDMKYDMAWGENENLNRQHLIQNPLLHMKGVAPVSPDPKMHLS
jgi:hypothetical protein